MIDGLVGNDYGLWNRTSNIWKKIIKNWNKNYCMPFVSYIIVRAYLLSEFLDKRVIPDMAGTVHQV